MIEKKILKANRIRHIDGGFSFIPHRFITDGFLAALNQKELLLYLFLVLASDRYGLSFYSYDAICSLLGLSVDEYIEARDGLIEKDLVAYDGTVFQVLELPQRPRQSPGMKEHRSRIKNFIQQSLWEGSAGQLVQLDLRRATSFEESARVLASFISLAGWSPGLLDSAHSELCAIAHRRVDQLIVVLFCSW